MTTFMTYKEECESLRRQLAEKDAEIERLQHENDLAFGSERYAKKQLAASQAREQQLREKVSELINAAPGHAGQCSGLKCREPYCYSCNDEYEADEYLQQVWDLCHSARELLKQTDTTALSAMIAKAGEVMRERCAYEAVRIDSTSCARACNEIRALPAVTLSDLKCSN